MQSSRYMEYDYDNECIVGFDDDDDDNNMMFGLLRNNSMKLYPMQLNVELIGDRWWRKKKQRSKKKRRTATPSPISPFINGIKGEEEYIEFVDKFDKTATDKRISLCLSDKSLIVRRDPFNGVLYGTHGTQVIDGYFKWKFIIHYDSSMIFGLIDADICGEQKMNILVDTKNVFGGINNCVIEVIYDPMTAMDGYLMVKNITNGINTKRIVVCKGINTKKRYKLTVLLNKPSTITMF